MSANTLLTSVVTGGSNNHATVAEEANAYATDFVSAGVVGTFSVNVGSGGTGSFCVNADAAPDMGVAIKAGQAYVTATPSGQGSQVLRVRAAADYTVYTINANASGSTKYDWIYLSVSATNANTPSAAADNVASFVTSRSSSNTTDNGTPPTYGLLLAIVTVANAASSITNSVITDKRVQASVSTAGTSSTTGWITGLTVPNTVVANGNRSYTLTVNGTDLTGTVSPGMRLRTTRLVAAPTQCTSLNGTTQYYSKTSPAGTVFTNLFTCMAWVKMTNYQAGRIISKESGTNGFDFSVNASGQVYLEIQPSNATTKYFTSYQSIPLNKWVHVAATMDATGTANHVYIDGIDVPGFNTGTATSLTQAGNLGIGATSAGASFFNGKIAQAAYFSAVLSQATIQSYMSQGLAGTETSLISAYSFNNSINDLNANANNLTANGSAVATATDSPFGGQAGGAISSTLDYGIITSASFSTNTTLVVQVPEGCTIPTSGGVSAVSYATVKAPYGMPVQQGKWEILTVQLADETVSISAVNQWFPSLGGKLTVPIGEWLLGYQFSLQAAYTSAAAADMATLLSGSVPTNAVYNQDLSSYVSIVATASGFNHAVKKDIHVSLAAATTYTQYSQTSTIGAAASWKIRGTQGMAIFYARNAHL